MTPLESLLKRFPTPWHVVRHDEDTTHYGICAAQGEFCFVDGLAEDTAHAITDVVNGLSERVGELEGAVEEFLASQPTRLAGTYDPINQAPLVRLQKALGQGEASG